MSTYLHWIFYSAYILTVVATVITVIMENRQPTKTMAWVLVLAFVPVVGIVFYFFFGQNTRKMRFISQRSLDQLSRRSMLEFVAQRGLHFPERHERLIRMFASQGQALPFKDTEAEILDNGHDYILSLLHAIGRAKHHIHFDVYIFDCDALGMLLADALIDKARQGVEVRLIYDDVGCWRVPDKFFQRMRQGGVDVRPFMPVRFPAFTSKVNYRNHRKLCVIDGCVAFIGGMNIALRYVKGQGEQLWRDTHLRVRGGAVYGVQCAFLVDWYFVARTLISDRRYYPLLPDTVLQNDCLAQVVTSSPIAPWPEIMQGYVRIITEARSYVYIETPYFLPTEPVIEALRSAALAGVDVRIIIPERSDSRWLAWAATSYVVQMAKVGVKFYLYKAGFNHSKLLVCDDSLCTCGSTNVDFRSFDYNFEANIFFYDEQMAQRMKSLFLDDLTFSLPLADLNTMPRPPFLRKLWVSLVRLLSPLL